MNHLQRVRDELARYEHQLVDFDAREASNGCELLISIKPSILAAHTYVAPIHPRDIEHTQFPWTFQKFLYDCLHDFLCEFFTRNPQEITR